MVWKANAVDCSAIAFQQQGPGVLLKCEKLVWEKVWLRQQGNDPRRQAGLTPERVPRQKGECPAMASQAGDRISLPMV